MFKDNPKYYKELQDYAKTNNGLVDGFVSKDGVIKITSEYFDLTNPNRTIADILSDVVQDQVK